MIHFKPFKFGQAEIWFLGALVGLVLLSVGIMTVPTIADWYTQVTDTWTGIALRYGYLGAFVSAFIGSISFVIVFPYTIIVFFLAVRGLDPFALGILMGLGAALGQMSGYLIGLWGAHFVQSKRPETYDALGRIVNYRPGFVQWLVFFVAVLPLPDDVLLVPLGILRYSWWRILIPVLAGKMISGIVVTYSSRFIGRTFEATTTAASLTAVISQIGTFVAVAAIIYLFFRLDWPRMMHRLLDRHAPPITTNSSRQP